MIIVTKMPYSGLHYQLHLQRKMLTSSYLSSGEEKQGLPAQHQEVHSGPRVAENSKVFPLCLRLLRESCEEVAVKGCIEKESCL